MSLKKELSEEFFRKQRSEYTKLLKSDPLNEFEKINLKNKREVESNFSWLVKQNVLISYMKIFKEKRNEDETFKRERERESDY